MKITISGTMYNLADIVQASEAGVVEATANGTPLVEASGKGCLVGVTITFLGVVVFVPDRGVVLTLEVVVVLTPGVVLVVL